jgi:hypothetical protein
VPPGRRAAVASIISALRPGGWLLAEDPDFVTLYASETDVVTRVVTQAVRLLETVSGGMDGPRFHRLQPHDRRILGTPGVADPRKPSRQRRQLAQIGYSGAEKSSQQPTGTTYRSDTCALYPDQRQ